MATTMHGGSPHSALPSFDDAYKQKLIWQKNDPDSINNLMHLRQANQSVAILKGATEGKISSAELSSITKTYDNRILRLTQDIKNTDDYATKQGLYGELKRILDNKAQAIQNAIQNNDLGDRVSNEGLTYLKAKAESHTEDYFNEVGEKDLERRISK